MEGNDFSLPNAKAISHCITVAIVLILVGMQTLYARPMASEWDYVLPGETPGGVTYALSDTESGQTGSRKESTVGYKAFDGANYQLKPYAGRFVTALLPVAPAGKEPFTADLINELVDRLDILYSNYRDLMQAEPQGSGSLTVAFVSSTCSIGCGWIGAKGIEVLQTEENNERIISDLESGRLDDLLNHEMAHNFDLYSAYISYLPDHAHAWTEIFEYFAPYRFARDSHDLQSADDLYQSPASSIWRPYLEQSSANWEKCVRDQLCGSMGLSENRLWAMIYYRIEKIHGIDAIQRSFSFLKNHATSNAVPKSAQEKEDLRLLSLAVEAGTNIACYLDALKWVVSPKLKSDMQSRFGNSNPQCADNDLDGYFLITGDCNDRDAAKSPGLEELQANGMDDDCDDIRDEVMTLEANGYDLPSFSSGLQQKQLPLEISGSLSDLKDRDAVKFSLPPDGRVRVQLCAQAEFSGWATALQPNGKFLNTEFWYEYLDTAGCCVGTFDFSAFASGGLEIIADRSAGAYSVTISAADSLPPEFSSLMLVKPRATGGVDLVISDTDDLLFDLGADELEVWISGVGTSLARPYQAQTTITLNSTSTVKLASGKHHQARLRPMRGGQPLASFSAGYSFFYDASPRSVPLLDSGYSGAWYDPSHEGEGFIIEVLDPERALVYWFTYTPDGKQRWMLGLGEIEGNSIVVPDLMRTHGGRFGNNFDPNDVVLQSLGNLSITFLDCNSATVNYSVNQVGDYQRLNRLSEVYGHRCGKPSETLSTDLSGSWYDPTHNGEGFIVEQLSAEQALVFWFTYTSSGEQAWMLNTASLINGVLQISELLQPTGGIFGRSFRPSAIAHQPWGELELELDCLGGDARYTSDLASFADGKQQLISLTRLQNSGCKP